MGLRPSDPVVTNIGTLVSTDAIPIDRIGVDVASKTTPANLAAYVDLQTKNYIPMDITPTSVPTTEGTLSWNSAYHTLNIQPDNAEVSLQVGEGWLYCYNGTGVDIPDGSVVYDSGAYNDTPSIVLAKANALETSQVMGVATALIPTGTFGHVTTHGKVHHYDTSAFTVGDTLWLSAVTGGGLVNVSPIPDNYSIPVATVLDVAVDGLIYVNAGNPSATVNATHAAIMSKDPTGFANNASIDVSYDSTARTITLTGDLQYVWRGAILSLTSPWTSTAHDATLDTSYFLHSMDGVNFAWATSAWEYSDIQVAYVCYGTAHKVAIREVHGLMPWQVHEEFHNIVGTYKLSGGALSSYVLASTTAGDRRPSVASTIIKDEDIRTTNAALTSDSFTLTYLSGTAPTNNFSFSQAEIVPVSVANPYYNFNNAGTWEQALMGNNTYQSIWLVAVPTTSDVDSQVCRYIWIQGQTNGTLAAEQALTPSSLELGGLRTTFSEFCFMTQVIIRFTSSNWTITQVRDLTRRVGL